MCALRERELATVAEKELRSCHKSFNALSVLTVLSCIRPY